MISKEEVAKLAELARLKLESNEIESVRKDISSILDYVGQVSAIALQSEKELPLLNTVLRDDTPREENDLLRDKAEVLRAAFPKHKGNFNVVRKIIEKNAE